MAVSFLVTGITATADVATPFANRTYPLPTGHMTGDLLIACFGGKPYDTVPSTPADWTAQSGGANGSTGMGAGTGSVYAVAFTKTHDGSESDPTSTFSAQYSPAIRAALAIRSPGASWTVTSTNGSDSTSTGTTFSATGASNLNYATDDIVVVLLVHNDDSSSDSSFGISIAGCEVGTVTQQLTGTLTTSTGNDGRMYVLTARITSGASSAAPVVTATTGSGDSDGQAVFLRVQGAVWANGPNLLAWNVATGTDTLADTTGFYSYDPTISSSTTRSVSGARSLKIDATSVRFSVGQAAASLAPVTAGRSYAAGFSCYPTLAETGGYNWVCYITWYTSAKAYISEVTVATVTLTVDTWNTLAGGGVHAPATAAYAEVMCYRAVAAGVTEESAWVDNLFLREGNADAAWELPPNASGSLTLGGSAAARAPVTASGSLTLDGDAEAEDGSGSQAASGSGSLTLGGSAAAKAAATASGSLTLGGSAAAKVAATASGALTLGGSASGKAAATASGSLALAGTAAWVAPTATGSLTLGGSAAAKAAATAAGAIALGGSATASTAATAAGALTLDGTAGSLAPPAAGSLTLDGTAIGSAPVTAAGSLELDGSVADDSPTATGSLTLGGSATAGAIVAGDQYVDEYGNPYAAPAIAGSLTLGGSAGGQAPTSSGGSLTLSGTATAKAAAVATGAITLAGTATAGTAAAAAGSLTLGGTADWAVTTATGAITLGGSATARAAATALGRITLSGLAAAAANAAAVGLIELAGTATGQAPATATGVLTFGGSAYGYSVGAMLPLDVDDPTMQAADVAGVLVGATMSAADMAYADIAGITITGTTTAATMTREPV